MRLSRYEIRRLIVETLLNEGLSLPGSDEITYERYTDSEGYRFKVGSDGTMLLVGKGKVDFYGENMKSFDGNSKITVAKNLIKDLVKKGQAVDNKSALYRIANPTTTSSSRNEDMYTAIDDKGTHYRILTSGEILRFGVTKNGKFIMDDPPRKIAPPADKEVAKKLLNTAKLEKSARETLENILKGVESNDNPIDTATNLLLRTLRKAAQALGTKIYLVGFLDFLLGRTSTFTEADLNDRYKKDLAKVAAIALKTNDGKILGSNDFVYNNFWVKASRALGQGMPTTPVSPNPGPSGTGTVEDFMYFLGGMTVKLVDDNYVITDIYDFDDYFTKPQAFKEFSDFAKGVSVDDLYKKTRKIAAWRQASGYSGYRVKITLPKSLAK